MATITKAVIPCGGMGTRFLPITKTLAKEMLPIIDTPVLSYIIDEAVNSGITDILLIINERKREIIDYFTPNPKLEESLFNSGKTAELELLKGIYSKANISFAYQNEAKGSADAVFLAKNFTGDEAFCLSWGDDVISAVQPVMRQLIEAYDDKMDALVGVQQVLSDDIVKYGVADVESSNGKLHKLNSIEEKPALDEIPSRLASLGRFILSKNIYDAIEKTKPGLHGEYQLTDSIKLACKNGGVYAYEFDGKRFDMGDKLGATKAVTEFALKNEQFGEQYKQYLRELVKSL